MKNRTLFSLCILLLVSACSSSPSPVKPPVALTDIEKEFSLTLLWRKTVGQGAGENYLRFNPLILDENIISVDYTGYIAVMNKKTGSLVWEKNLNLPISTAPAHSAGKILFGTSQGELLVLDIDKGNILWRKQLSSEVLSTPQVGNDIIVTRTVDGRLYGLSIDDGAQLWVYDRTVPVLTLRGTSRPIISNDIVINGFDNGKLVALTLQDGRVLWENSVTIPRGRTELERIIDIDMSPVIKDDIIYVATYQGRIAAIELASGRLLWSREVSIFNNIAVDAYRLYFTDAESKVWALDRTNGATLWKQDKLLRRAVTGPVLYQDQVVVGDFNGTLHWLSRKDGKIVSRVEFDVTIVHDERDIEVDEYFDTQITKANNILATPVIDGEILYAMNRHGQLHAYTVAADPDAED